ncbi:Uncharacterised protein [Vibrio cholerae]|nr:Uncharacterised protein [Vibrio cholerae]
MARHQHAGINLLYDGIFNFYVLHLRSYCLFPLTLAPSLQAAKQSKHIQYRNRCGYGVG